MIKILYKYDWLFVVGLFLIVEILINPIGEFPLNDDWAYSKAIYNYVENGSVKFSNWQGFPDLTRFLISSSICKVFGFSFTLLRCITLITFMISILVFNHILRFLQLNNAMRWPLLLILTFNPLSLYLANTYLSDVFQLLLTLISFQLMLLYFRNRQSSYFILFCLITTLATLNRQISLVIPIAFSIIYFFNTIKQERRSILMILPFIVNFSSLLIYESWAKSNQLLPANYYIQLDTIFTAITHPSFQTLKKIAYYFITSTVCLGLLIAPLTIPNLKTYLQQIKKIKLQFFVSIIYLSIVIFKIIVSANPLPFVGNIFYHLGVGPVILTGFNSDEPIQQTTWVNIIYITLTVLGAISFISALLSIISIYPMKKISAGFILLLLIVYLIPLCFNYANDRYLLLLFPFLIMAYMLVINNSFKSVKFLVLFLPLFYFSFSAVFNHMSLNKAREKATQYLTNELKINPRQIDGGFEFNGWYLSEEGKNYIPSHTGRWWWIDKNDYIISTVRRADYIMESEIPVKTISPSSFDTVFVLKKNSLN